MNPKEKEHSFMVTGIPTSIYKLLPLPYARPSRVAFIKAAIVAYAAAQRAGVDLAEVMRKLQDGYELTKKEGA